MFLRLIALIILAKVGLFLRTELRAGRLAQGPMVGAIDSNSVTVWARVAGEHAVSIRYSELSSFSNAKVTTPVFASAENDYCVQVQLFDLEPNAYYYYQVLIDGQPVDNEKEDEGFPFLTAPVNNAPVRFSIGFGSGARADIDGLQAIWLQVQNARPHAFFWLGQNEPFSGLPIEFQAEAYQRQRNIPFLQPLLRSIPQLATWGSTKSAPLQEKKASFEVFQRYWANPGYGTESAPGSYFSYQYGGVDFIFLDTYTYRDDLSRRTILGEDQMDWLQRNLVKSDAAFKVLLSGSSWTNQAANDQNTWMAFREDREGLFAFIRENKVHGVILLSGDDDEAEIKVIPMSRKGGYDLYEIVSSPLGQDPKAIYSEDNPTIITIEEPYSESMNFGTLTFDMSEEDPKATLKIINILGENVFPKFELRASELTVGRVSWKDKVSPEAVAHYESQADDNRL